MADHIERAVRKIIKQELTEFLKQQKATDKTAGQLQKQIDDLQGKLAALQTEKKAIRKAQTKKAAVKPGKFVVNTKLLAAKLLAYRTRNDITAGDLSKQLNVAYLTYRNWESGKCAPRMPLLERIAELLKLEVSALGKISLARKERAPRTETPPKSEDQ